MSSHEPTLVVLDANILINFMNVEREGLLVELRGVLATDERAAKKLASRQYPDLTVIDTVGLVVRMIRAGLLSVPEADEMKLAWEERYRFSVGFRSFGDPPPGSH